MRYPIFIIILFPFLVSNLKIEQKDQDKLVEEFSGRVSKVNSDARILRVKVDFRNVKYLNKKDIIYFGSKHRSGFRCQGYILGKTSDYLLIKVPNLDFCERKLPIGAGYYFNFFSRDLGKNLRIGKELVKILLKKRQALKGRLEVHQADLVAHMERVEVTNKRYALLRIKLEAEWVKELSSLEEDKIQSLRNLKGIEIRMNEVEFKLEKYRIEDKSLRLDRWALDPKQYILK